MKVRLWKRIRLDPELIDENSNLWVNGSTWWIHFTMTNGVVNKRIRKSLKTRDIVKARAIRDRLFAAIDSAVITSV